MTLPLSGVLSMSDIVAEFGGTAPHGLSEYYGAAAGIPASGQLAVSDFYGASALAWTSQVTSGDSGTRVGFRSLIDGTITEGSATNEFVTNSPNTDTRLQSVFYTPANNIIWVEFKYTQLQSLLPTDWIDEFVFADGSTLAWHGDLAPTQSSSGSGFYNTRVRWQMASLAECQAKIPAGTWDFSIRTLNY